jgi:nitrogen regulatory protein P-II 1
MKQIQAIIRREKLGDVMSALANIKCAGMMVWEIMGYGKQQGITEQIKGREYKVDLMPKTKIEIVSEDSKVRSITNAIIKSANTGNVGDGKIFISNIEEAIRVRTGEKGDLAIE